MGTSAKTRRVEVRIGDDERRIDEAAAAALGLSLSEFFRQAAQGRAQEVLRERAKIVLDDAGARALLTALDADDPPPAAMRELFAREAPWTA